MGQKRIRQDRVFEPEELRVIESGSGQKKVVGYAAVFGKEATLGNFFRERVKKGAFAKTIQERDVLVLWDHDSGKPMARKGNGSLKLLEDDHGLKFEFTPNNTSWSNDAMEAIRRGDVRGMSFGFEIIKEIVVERKRGELPLFELQEVRLDEISPVTFPAYPETEVGLRHIRAALKARGLSESEEPTPNAGSLQRMKMKLGLLTASRKEKSIR